MMLLICNHGYYKFYIEDKEDLMHLKKIKGYDLLQENDYYTFNVLKNLKSYSFKNLDYIEGLSAIINYSGTKEKLFKLNEFIFNIKNNTVEKIKYIPTLYEGIFVKGVPQVGISYNEINKKVTGFVAEYEIHTDCLKILELETI